MAEPRSYARGGRRDVNNITSIINNPRAGPASFSSYTRPAQVEDFVFVPQEDPLLRSTSREVYGQYQQQPQPVMQQPPPPPPPQRAQPQPQPQPVARKIGEKLAKRYDMSEVRQEDIPSVNAAIYTVCTLEESAPELDIRPMAKNGYYALIIKGFNEIIDGPNMHDRLMGNPDPKTNIIGYSINPATGALIVRCGMLANGAPALEDNAAAREGPGPQKRQRPQQQQDDGYY